MNKFGKKRRKYSKNGHEESSAYEIAIKKIKEAYKFIERREVTVKTANDLPQLGGIYSAQMLKNTKNFQPNFREEDFIEDIENEQNDNRNRLLKLPSDGSIFHDGIPFHHFALTPLGSKHILRLKQHGVELKKSYFSSGEDAQIVENWLSFSSAHNIPEDHASIYMSAAVATETNDDHKDRLRFIHESLFRPWMCAKLLNRTASQVFRRCYHLYRVSLAETTDLRLWTSEDDKKLLKLVELHGTSWEFIGNELFHPRYSCLRRYRILTGIQRPIENDNGGCLEESDSAKSTKWSPVELARLYNYLCDTLPHNPVIIAIVPKYEQLDAHVDWCSSTMRLPLKSAAERKKKWDELKNQFKAVKERVQSDKIKQILREVISEDTRILAKAKRTRYRQKYLCPIELGEDVILLKNFCSEHSIKQLKKVSTEELEQELKSHGELKYEVKRFLSRVKYMLYCAHKTNLFKMLPIVHDNLEVHLELLGFILKNIKSFRVKKKVLRKYTRRFLKIKCWEQREDIVYVMKTEGKNIKWESTKEKIDVLQNRV